MGWLSERRQADERKVLLALAMLRPSRSSVWPIAQLAHLSQPRTCAALERLTGRGEVTAEWADGPYPRRRVYHVVRAGARS